MEQVISHVACHNSIIHIATASNVIQYIIIYKVKGKENDQLLVCRSTILIKVWPSIKHKKKK